MRLVAAYLCRVQPRPFSFAPLLGRPPGGSLVGALKRILFRPLIVATSPRDGHTGACRCWVRRRKRHARRRFGLKPCADSCRAGRAPRRERGAVVLIAVVVLGRSVCRSAETPA